MESPRIEPRKGSGLPITSSHKEGKKAGEVKRYSVIDIGKKSASFVEMLAERIVSIALDIFIALTIFSLQPFISLSKRFDPKPSEVEAAIQSGAENKYIDPKKPITILVNGYGGSSLHWLYHFFGLRRKGVKNLFTVDVGSPFMTIEESAALLAKRVEEIKEMYKGENREVIFVCHSMGGLIADAYKKMFAESSGTNVLDTITIGTPHAGTPVAYLTALFSKSARQMLPNSSFIKTRSMCSTRNYEDKQKNKINEHIIIDDNGVKTTKIHEKMNQPKHVDVNGQEITVKERWSNSVEVEVEKDHQKRKQVKTEECFVDVEGKYIFTETSKESGGEKGPELRISSRYDTIVPYKSAKYRTEAEKRSEKVKKEKINIGGHGWQLASPRVREIVFDRINKTISDWEKTKNSPEEVDTSVD